MTSRTFQKTDAVTLLAEKIVFAFFRVGTSDLFTAWTVVWTLAYYGEPRFLL